MAKSTTLTVKLTPEAEAGLTAAARRERRTTAQMAEAIIQERLEADEEFAMVVAQRQAVPMGQRRYVSDEDVDRWLASWGKEDERPASELPTIT